MIVLVGIGLTYIFYNAFYIWREDNKLPKWFRKLIDRKPLNCDFCLSFWIAIGFFITTGHYPAFLIPIGYELVRRIINIL